MTHEDHVLIATAALADVELRYDAYMKVWFSYRRGRLVDQYGWFTAARAASRALCTLGLRNANDHCEYLHRTINQARKEQEECLPTV